MVNAVMLTSVKGTVPAQVVLTVPIPRAVITVHANRVIKAMETFVSTLTSAKSATHVVAVDLDVLTQTAHTSVSVPKDMKVIGLVWEIVNNLLT